MSRTTAIDCAVARSGQDLEKARAYRWERCRYARMYRQGGRLCGYARVCRYAGLSGGSRQVRNSGGHRKCYRHSRIQLDRIQLDFGGYLARGNALGFGYGGRRRPPTDRFGCLRRCGNLGRLGDGRRDSQRRRSCGRHRNEVVPRQCWGLFGRRDVRSLRLRGAPQCVQANPHHSCRYRCRTGTDSHANGNPDDQPL